MLCWDLEEDSEEGRALLLVSLVAEVASAASSRLKVRRGKPLAARGALVHPHPTVISHAVGPCTAPGLHAPPFCACHHRAGGRLALPLLFVPEIAVT